MSWRQWRAAPRRARASDARSRRRTARLEVRAAALGHAPRPWSTRRGLRERAVALQHAARFCGVVFTCGCDQHSKKRAATSCSLFRFAT
eukprot:6187426-Pleurochrysis_carterae.AAC.1